MDQLCLLSLLSEDGGEGEQERENVIMTFEDHLNEHLRFGRYHLLQNILCFLITLSSAAQNLSIIFTGQVPSFLCDSSTNFSDDSSANSTSVCFDNDTCPQLVFSQDMQTVVTKYKLVCERKFYLPLISTMYMIGFFWGSPAFGYISDRWGRLVGCLVCGLNTFICSIVAAFAPNYFVYIIFRMLTAFGASGQATVILTLVAESVSGDSRAIVLSLILTAWPFSMCFLSFVFFFFENQTHVELVIASLSLLTVVLFLLFQESPRWLIAQDRFEEAKLVLEKIAKLNKQTKSIDTDELKEWVPTNSCQERATEEESVSIKSFVMNPGLRRLSFSLWFIIGTTSLLFYGFAYGISSQKGMSIYLQAIMGACIEIAMVLSLIPALRFCERLWLTISAFTIMGIFVVAVCTMISDPQTSLPVTVLCVIARAMTGALFNAETLYIIEVYPTTHRNLGVGCASASARIGAIIASQILTLAHFWKPAPYLIYSVCCIITVSLKMFLPETKHNPCPETVQDAEAIIKKHRFYRDQLRCRRKVSMRRSSFEMQSVET